MPPVPLNGQAITKGNDEFNVNQEISYVCDKGYILTGHGYNLCDDHGEWSHEAPKCQRMHETF